MNTLARLKEYNQIYKESDIIYHNYAKSCGLSDMAFWILYSMAERDKYFTQRDFCNEWFSAPQSVNSALKDLEKKGIIFLEVQTGNKKNKLIKPTKSGEEFIKSFIMPLIKTECESFASLSGEECKLMLTLTKKYISALRDNLKTLEAARNKNQALSSEV